MNASNKLLSDLVSFRTYSKYLAPLARRETLEETVNRSMIMHLSKFPFLSRDITKAFTMVHDLEIMPSMRSLQFAGDPIIKNNARLYNCSATAITTPRKFSEVLFLLLSGTGVGFSVQRRHINKLPKIGIPAEEGVYFVQDSIIGWAQALDALMNSYFYRSVRPIFNFSNIRAKGSPLITTGAKAPGPEPLRQMLETVEKKLKFAIGRNLRSLEVHDIICIVSDCVLAGGIRRSACISLFDRDDKEMLGCKSGKWFLDHPYRARANNSAILPRTEVTKEEFQAIFKACQESGAGEPGLSWSNDPEDLFNPCFSGETLITTKDGSVEIKDLVGKEVEIHDGHDWVKINNFRITAHDQQILKITLSDGSFVRLTPYHTCILANDVTIKAKDLVEGDVLKKSVLTDKPENFNKILSIKNDGIEKNVFCCTVPTNHTLALSIGIQFGQCHEISLRNNGFCNLVTVNQTGIQDKKEFLKRLYSATLIATLQAAYTDFPYLGPEWKNCADQDALIGVSFTGIADQNDQISDEWLQEGAALVLEVNEKYAKKIGINLAARTTTLKPEGTCSCVLGSSSGIHSRHSKLYVRRFQINKDDPLYHYLKSAVPDLVEDCRSAVNTAVVAIPQESPLGAICRENETAEDLFNRAMKYNKNWVASGHRSGANKNNVSCTISVKPEEWSPLSELMWKNRNHYSGISLLPFDDSTYDQMPFTACDQTAYDNMSKLVKNIDFTQIKEMENNTNLLDTSACSGGLCSIEYK